MGAPIAHRADRGAGRTHRRAAGIEQCAFGWRAVERGCVVIVRYSEGSAPLDKAARSFGIPQDDNAPTPATRECAALVFAARDRATVTRCTSAPNCNCRWR